MERENEINEKENEIKNELNLKLQKVLNSSDIKRFLIARKLDTSLAITMISSWEIWYYNTILPGQTITPRHILDEIEDPLEYLHTRLCPISHMGEDKDGRPIYWEKSGFISGSFQELINEMTVDDMLTRHIRNSELTTCRMNYLTNKYGKTIDQQVVVFDLKDLTYSLDTRTLSVFGKCTSIDNDYYPERLYRCYMINAPWFFTAIWSLLQPFIDPVTRQKIKILGSNFLNELRETINDDQIPVEYGGTWQDIKWNWPYPESSGCSPQQVKEYNINRNDLDQSIMDEIKSTSIEES